jgi:hypothetical protein
MFIVSLIIMRFEYVAEVINISCDHCGYYDSAEKFPDFWGSRREYIETMERFGNGDELTLGVGVVCPVCGNYYEFDFDPDNDVQKRMVKVPISEQEFSGTQTFI